MMDCLRFATAMTEYDEPPSTDSYLVAGAGSGIIIDRHDGTTNYAFVDFSVRSVGLKEAYKLKWYEQMNVNGPWTLAGQPPVMPESWPLWMQKFKDYQKQLCGRVANV